MTNPTSVTHKSARYDVLVIGAGIGGVCAAVQLAQRGYRTLLVERLDRVGGRASTQIIDGFRVNTGAAVCELGGSLEKIFDYVGIPYPVRVPRRPVVARLGRVTVNISPLLGGRLNVLLRWFCRSNLRRLPRTAAKQGLQPNEMTVQQWLNRITTNDFVHAVLRNPLASFFVADEDELPAEVVFMYFSEKTGLRRIAIHPEGTIGISRALVERFCALGGELWTGSQVRRLCVTDGKVGGAVIDRQGAETEVACALAISDAGPRATITLAGAENFPEDYLRQVERLIPGVLMSVNFATQEPLKSFGAMVFGKTKNHRLLEVVNFTDTCPEMAPDGWHLYLGWGLPASHNGDFDSDAELALLLEDMRQAIPGFCAARILSTSVARGDRPAQHALSGTDVPPATPIPNLWNVGDGVKDYGDGGMECVAKVASGVVDEIVRAHAPASAQPTI